MALRADAPAFVPSVVSPSSFADTPTHASVNTTANHQVEGSTPQQTYHSSRKPQHHHHHQQQPRGGSSRNQQEKRNNRTNNRNKRRKKPDSSRASIEETQELPGQQRQQRRQQQQTGSQRHKGKHRNTQQNSRQPPSEVNNERSNAEQPDEDEILPKQDGPPTRDPIVFPSLIATETPQSATETEPSSLSCWSKETATNAVKEALWLEQQQQQAPDKQEPRDDGADEPLETTTTNLSLVTGDVTLTLLSSSSKKRTPTKEKKPQPLVTGSPKEDATACVDNAEEEKDSKNNNEKEDSKEGQTDPTPTAPTPLSSLSRRRTDMSKLRDRWWELLRNQPVVIEPAPKRESSLSNSINNKNRYHGDDGEAFLQAACNHEQQQQQARGRVVVPLTQQPNSPYFENQHPLHEAISRNDKKALRALLTTTSHDLSETNHGLSPIELAVHLRRPELLRILLVSMTWSNNSHHNSDKSSNTETSGSLMPAMHMAVAFSYDECVAVFLENNTASLFTRDENGNNPLHIACQHDSSSEILPLCLKSMENGTVGKVMLQKNKYGQTPTHVACASGRVDHVEAILAHCTYSLLSKILSTQDETWQTPLLAAVAAGSIDTVMCLLMWKGNNHKRIQEGGAKEGGALSWAVRARNVEMTLLLLEFNDSSTSPSSSSVSSSKVKTGNSDSSGNHLDNALHVAARMVSNQTVPCDATQLELVRVLTDAGANPCCNTSSSSGSSSSGQVVKSNAAIVTAAEAHEERLVQIMLETYDKVLVNRQTLRRRDPLLRKQPESYFRNIEEQEESERVVAIRQALLVTLFAGSADTSHAVDFHSCSLALYKSGVQLDPDSIERLKRALKTKDKSRLTDATINSSNQSTATFEASCLHPVGKPMQTDTKSKLDPSMFWSVAMLQNPWWETPPLASCRWLDDFGTAGAGAAEPFSDQPGDVELVSADGKSFVIHSSVVSFKSAKLDAAIRFERMRRGESEEEDDVGVVRLNLPINSQLTLWVLQHVYHGSMVGPFPETNQDLCRGLTELLEFADQHIMPSLAQEAEMRLLASDPRRCFCCHCSFCRPTNDTNEQKNEEEATTRTTTHSYLISGPSMCISADTALDVLATVLQLQHNSGSHAYDLLLLPEKEATQPSWFDDNASTTTSTKKFTILPALEQLCEVASARILSELGSILKTNAFASSFQDEEQRCGDETSLSLSQQRESFMFLVHTCIQGLLLSKIE